MTSNRMLRVLRAACLCALTWAGALPGADVAFYGIAKLQQFQQTNAGAPAALPSNGFAFASFVLATTNLGVTNATVKPSNSATVRTLDLDTNSQVLLGYTNFFSTLAQLDQAFPASSGQFSPVNYTVTMNTAHDGSQTGALAFYLLAPYIQLSYPATPEITQFAEAQSIDSAQDYTLQWKSLGGSTLLLVQLTVTDDAGSAWFSSALPFQPGALNGASNSVVIPAGSLPAGAQLTGHLTAANPGLPNTNSYTGATGVPVLVKTLAFALATRPAPAALRLVQASKARDSAPFSFQFATEASVYYQVEAATRWTNWTMVFETNSPGGVVTFTDPSPAPPWRFYRVKSGR